MKRIPLTRGKFALVDDEDYEWLTWFKWHTSSRSSNDYAGTNIRVSSRKTILLMHAAILRAPAGMEIDHVNGDGLDNRRRNLRPATRTQNCANKRSSGRASGYRGVYWHAHSRCWEAKLQVRRQRVYLGQFSTKIVAARAYDAAVRHYYGEFASTNFGPQKERTRAAS